MTLPLSRIILLGSVFALLGILWAAGGWSFVKPPSAEATRFTLKDDGNLYTVSTSLGEKRLTNGGNIQIVFARKNGNILLGKTMPGDIPDSEHVVGTTLFLLQDDGTNMRLLTDVPVMYAFFDPTGRQVYYTSQNADLFVFDLSTSTTQKLQEKVLSPSLSPDGRSIIYQKLNPTWGPGQYYDEALGITVLNLQTKQETRISNTWEDFNPLWTPDGKNILFFSRSAEGLASHFVMDANGKNRKQLTNIGQGLVTDKTVAIPSELPQWSSDGKTLIYEADRQIWINEFAPGHSAMLKAKPVAYGRDPEWLPDGKTFTAVITPRAKGQSTLLTMDSSGNILP